MPARMGRSPPRSSRPAGAPTSSGVLRDLAAEGALLEGEFRPGGSGTEWVAPDVLRRVRRRTLAAVRRAVEPVEAEALARFLPAWQGIGRDQGRGIDRLRDAVAQLQGIALPVEAWETDVLPTRVPGYTPAMLDELTAGGEVVWIGAGRGRVALHPRSDARLVGGPGIASEVSHPILDALRSRGAMFFSDLVAALGESERQTLAELWGLVWAGAVTNDAWQPLRSGATLRCVDELRPGRSGRRARPTASLPAARGRWSLVEGLLQPAPAPRERARALAETLLDRHGVVTRAAVLGEGIPGGFSAVYGELRLMEEAGLAQRGYFVEGLGGAQFAVTTAVERLRDVREADPVAPPVVLAAVDPANPYGAALPWPEASRKLPASPAPGSSWRAAGRRSTSRRAGAASSRSSRSCWSRRSRRWRAWSSRAGPGALHPNGSTASRSSARRPSGFCSTTASSRGTASSCCGRNRSRYSKPTIVGIGFRCEYQSATAWSSAYPATTEVSRGPDAAATVAGCPRDTRWNEPRAACGRSSAPGSTAGRWPARSSRALRRGGSTSSCTRPTAAACTHTWACTAACACGRPARGGGGTCSAPARATL